MCDGVLLMGSKANLHYHRNKADVKTVIFTRQDIIEHYIVLFAQYFLAFWAFENLVLERLTYGLSYVCQKKGRKISI